MEFQIISKVAQKHEADRRLPLPDITELSYNAGTVLDKQDRAVYLN